MSLDRRSRLFAWTRQKLGPLKREDSDELLVLDHGFRVHIKSEPSSDDEDEDLYQSAHSASSEQSVPFSSSSAVSQDDHEDDNDQDDGLQTPPLDKSFPFLPQLPRFLFVKQEEEEELERAPSELPESAPVAARSSSSSPPPTNNMELLPAERDFGFLDYIELPRVDYSAYDYSSLYPADQAVAGPSRLRSPSSQQNLNISNPAYSSLNLESQLTEMSYNVGEMDYEEQGRSLGDQVAAEAVTIRSRSLANLVAAEAERIRSRSSSTSVAVETEEAPATTRKRSFSPQSSASPSPEQPAKKRRGRPRKRPSTPVASSSILPDSAAETELSVTAAMSEDGVRACSVTLSRNISRTGSPIHRLPSEEAQLQERQESEQPPSRESSTYSDETPEPPSTFLFEVDNEEEMRLMYEKVASIMAATANDDNSDQEDAEGSDAGSYEARRAKNLLANQVLLAELGLGGPSTGLDAASRSPSPMLEDPVEQPQASMAYRRLSASPEKPTEPKQPPRNKTGGRSIKLAEDGTTVSLPLPGTVHELAYVNIAPLNPRQRSDYIFVDSFLVRAPTPTPEPSPSLVPETQPLERKSSRRQAERSSPQKAKAPCKLRVPKGPKAYPTEGPACHQCRRKSDKIKIRCSNVGLFPDGSERQCPFYYCVPCLRIRYGAGDPNEPEETCDPDDENWKCPKCRACCNCSVCLDKAGLLQLLYTGDDTAGSRFSMNRALQNAPGDLTYRSVKHYIQESKGITKIGTGGITGAVLPDDREGQLLAEIARLKGGPAVDQPKRPVIRKSRPVAPATPAKSPNKKIVVRLKRPVIPTEWPAPQSGVSLARQKVQNAFRQQESQVWVKGTADISSESDGESELTSIEDDEAEQATRRAWDNVERRDDHQPDGRHSRASTEDSTLTSLSDENSRHSPESSRRSVKESDDHEEMTRAALNQVFYGVFQATQSGPSTAYEEQANAQAVYQASPTTSHSNELEEHDEAGPSTGESSTSGSSRPFYPMAIDALVDSRVHQPLGECVQQAACSRSTALSSTALLEHESSSTAGFDPGSSDAPLWSSPRAILSESSRSLFC